MHEKSGARWHEESEYLFKFGLSHYSFLKDSTYTALLNLKMEWENHASKAETANVSKWRQQNYNSSTNTN